MAKKKSFAGYPETVFLKRDASDGDGPWFYNYEDPSMAFDTDSTNSTEELAIYELRSVKRFKLEKQVVEVS